MAKTFQELSAVDPLNVLVVDALNLAFRWKHSGAKTFSEEYVNTVRSLARSYNCGTILIASDWGSSSYRKTILPSYKGNRELLRAEQTEQEKQAFEAFIQEFENTLNTLLENNFKVLRFRNVEADDIAAYITKFQGAFNHLWLISSDKDWDLLISDKVSRFSYVTRKETTLATWSDHYEVPTAKYLTYKCLIGDKGDNIPGVTGIGPKRATDIINNYGDIFEIHESLPIPGKQKFIQAINDSADLLLKNVELMDLVTYCEDAIGLDNCGKIREIVLECL